MTLRSPVPLDALLATSLVSGGQYAALVITDRDGAVAFAMVSLAPDHADRYSMQLYATKTLRPGGYTVMVIGQPRYGVTAVVPKALVASRARWSRSSAVVRWWPSIPYLPFDARSHEVTAPVPSTANGAILVSGVTTDLALTEKASVCLRTATACDADTRRDVSFGDPRSDTSSIAVGRVYPKTAIRGRSASLSTESVAAHTYAHALALFI